MTERKRFAVVEFLKEKAVEVVPINWIHEGNENCAYPQGPRAGILRKDPNSQPLKTWPIYPIKLKYTADSFDKANRRADNFQYTSTVSSSDDSPEEKKGRKKKARKLFSPSPQKAARRGKNKKKDTSTISSTDVAGLSPIYPAPRLPNDLLPGSSSTKLHDISGGRHEVSSLVSPLPAAVLLSQNSSVNISPQALCFPRPETLPEQQESDLELEEVPEANNSDDSGQNAGHLSPSYRWTSQSFDYSLTTPLSRGESSVSFRRQFELFQRRMFSELHDIKEDLATIKGNTYRTSGRTTECPVSIPFDSETELDAAEEKLTDRTQLKIFEKWSAQVGGSSFKIHCRRILKNVFSHQFSRKLNFTGRNAKIAFSNLKIGNSIINAVVLSHDVDRNEVEKVIKEWFRCSADHNGGRDKRRNGA